MIAPDPIPAPVRLSEARARKVLLTIAALHGGSVQRMADLDLIGRPDADRGLAYMPAGLLPTWMVDPTWLWRSQVGEMGWWAPRVLGPRVIALGRIDRGLGSK